MTVHQGARTPVARARFGLYPGVFSPLGKAVLPSLLVGCVFLALAWSAQARSGGVQTLPPGHGTAMLVLFWLTVSVCGRTWATPGARIVAVEAAVAAVAGPMSLTAAPGSPALMDSGGSPVWWWSALIAAGELTLVAAMTAVLARGRPHTPAGRAAVPMTGSTARVAFAGAFAVALAVLLLVPGWTQDPGHGAIPTRMLLGWAALAAATFVATMATRSVLARSALVALPGLTVFGMYAAYSNAGGWPAVPGWELGTRAPLFATVGTATVVIVAPILAIATAAVRSRVARGDATGPHAAA